MKLNSIALAATLTAAALTGAAHGNDYSSDIAFDVYRNGSPFGEHVVRFSEDDDGDLRVDINIELDVKFGPVTVFRYRHSASEEWRDDQLVALTARTFKDGEWQQVAIARNDDGTLRSLGGMLADLPPSSHWRGYADGAFEIINTETGEPMAVTVEDLGMEIVETGNGPIEARRMRLSGSLTVDLWYDADGRWVGCAFDARGQEIRYILRDV